MLIQMIKRSISINGFIQHFGMCRVFKFVGRDRDRKPAFFMNASHCRTSGNVQASPHEKRVDRISTWAGNNGSVESAHSCQEVVSLVQTEAE
jgi:hypothetical protein